MLKRLRIFFSEKEYILYDEFHRAEFARPNLDTHLQNLYNNESELIVVFICADYNIKEWCGIEWRAIRELLNSKKADDKILLVKCGQGVVDGVFNTVDGYIDATQVSTDDLINDIVSRYYLITNKKSIGPIIRENGETNQNNIKHNNKFESMFKLESNDKVESDFLSTKDKQRDWNYNIILLDDMQEQLDMLEEEIQALVDSDSRYNVRILSVTKAIDVVIGSQNIDIDVFVLDVARNQSLKWQTKQFDYFGYDLYKQLVAEKPNVLIKSKFFILSKLPTATVRKEFEGADVVYLRKQTTSNAEVARQIKEYLDLLYMEENSKN